MSAAAAPLAFPSTRRRRGTAVIASARQRVRRALRRLSLTPPQAERVSRALRDELGQMGATREMLAECRRQLREALATATPDSSVVLELTVQERLLQGRERQISAALERSLVGLLRPEQAVCLQALPPAVLGDVLGRLCA
jgi:Spy/CpxP family protein refolding chaperone